MPEHLALRFDAPLIGFGGVAVDNYGVVAAFPPLSMLTGLLGNALGLRHRDADSLERLQQRLRYAVRRDRAGGAVRDFQTVDLGQPHMVDTGWTTRGVPMDRKAGDPKKATHIRFRDYHADAVFTVVLTLTPENEEPSLAALEVALREPARPLFIGRKPCLPASPVLVGRVQGSSLREALAGAPSLDGGRSDGTMLLAWWPDDGSDDGRVYDVTDARDWRNQIHVGRRLIREGLVEVKDVE